MSVVGFAKYAQHKSASACSIWTYKHYLCGVDVRPIQFRRVSSHVFCIGRKLWCDTMRGASLLSFGRIGTGDSHCFVLRKRFPRVFRTLKPSVLSFPSASTEGSNLPSLPQNSSRAVVEQRTRRNRFSLPAIAKMERPLGTLNPIRATPSTKYSSSHRRISSLLRHLHSCYCVAFVHLCHALVAAARWYFITRVGVIVYPCSTQSCSAT